MGKRIHNNKTEGPDPSPEASWIAERVKGEPIGAQGSKYRKGLSRKSILVARASEALRGDESTVLTGEHLSQVNKVSRWDSAKGHLESPTSGFPRS